MNIAPISEPNTMIPAQAATQNVRPGGDVEVVERVGARAAGARRSATSATTAIASEHQRERALVRHRREVDRQDQRADEHEREDAAEVVDRLGRSR